MRVEDLRQLEVYDNDRLWSLLRCCRCDRIPCASLHQGYSLRALPSVPLQRRLRWFGHAFRPAPGEIIREVICPTPRPTKRKRRGRATEDLVEDHPGGPRASWRSSGLWPTTMEPGVASNMHRDGPGPPCMVRDREGCRKHIGGQPDPTRMIAASVTVSSTKIKVTKFSQKPT